MSITQGVNRAVAYLFFEKQECKGDRVLQVSFQSCHSVRSFSRVAIPFFGQETKAVDERALEVGKM